MKLLQRGTYNISFYSFFLGFFSLFFGSIMIRVLWLAGELGIPLRVNEITPQPSLRMSRETERPLERGGMVRYR